MKLGTKVILLLLFSFMLIFLLLISTLTLILRNNQKTTEKLFVNEFLEVGWELHEKKAAILLQLVDQYIKERDNCTPEELKNYLISLDRLQGDVIFYNFQGENLLENYSRQDYSKLISKNIVALELNRMKLYKTYEFSRTNYKGHMNLEAPPVSALFHIYPSMEQIIGFGHIFHSSRLRLTYLREINRKNSRIFIATGVIISFACLSIIFTLVLLYFRRSVTQPLELIARKAAAYQPGTGPLDLEKNRKDEIGTLVQTLNRMTLRLDQFFTKNETAERETRQLKNHLNNIINSLPSVIFSLDKEERLIYWNRNFARLSSGIIKEKQSALSCFPGLSSYLPVIRKVIHQGGIQEIKKAPNIFRADNGFMDMVIAPLGRRNEEGVVIRIDDITEQIYMEEMFIHSEKMISLGRMTAGIAHEINNPLGGIMQNIQVMENRLSPDFLPNKEDAEKTGISLKALKQYLEARDIPGRLRDIRQAGKRAAGIVENMLSFSRKTGDLRSETYVREILENSLELALTDYEIKKKHSPKNIQILRNYPSRQSRIYCNPIQIQQVFFNLLKNSFQAMGNQGILFLTIYDKKRNVIIEIEDTGPGIKEGNKIFEPFYTTKSPGEGTGLGLSVSYFIIVKNHKGKLTQEKGKDGGARFIIELPSGG